MGKARENNTISKYVGAKWYAVTVIGAGSQPEYLECLCKCGKRFEVLVERFKTGLVMSCGCDSSIPMDEELVFSKLRRTASRLVGRHGAGKSKADVCADWRESKVLFANWALNNGYKPGCSLKIIDKSKPYGPSNCVITDNRYSTSGFGDELSPFSEKSAYQAEESKNVIHVQISKSGEPTAFRGFRDKGYALPDAWDEIPVRDLTESEISKYFLEV